MIECPLFTIADICNRQPLSTSITFDGEQLTYGDLSLEVARVAKFLEFHNVSEGSLVAVSIERSEKLLPVLLGIWCIGAAYLPIDPSYPKNRKEHMLSDANAALLIVGSVDAVDLSFTGKSVLLDAVMSFDVDQSVKSWDLHQWSHKWQADAMAYMIYTSGSTGTPKGIAVSQSNVHNFLLGMLERPGLDPKDKLLAVTTICFDIHVLELFLPLTIGAEVHIIPRYIAVSGDRLRQYIDGNQISVLQATPTTWRILLNDTWSPECSLKMLVGGEPFPADLTKMMLDASDSVWNMYGPTETTVWSTCYQVVDPESPVLIGTPIRNTKIYVVDDNLDLVKQGDIGELLIGGDGVTMGTGDLVKQLADESLVYIQRKDDQFKIRGYRIEAGDVEAHILSFKGIHQVVVTVNQFGSGDDRLVAHVKSAGMINVQALRDYCKNKLPYYMVPQYFNQIEQFPQTENGKIDRKKLSVIKEFYSSEHLVRPQFSSARDDLDLSILEVWRKQLNLNDLSIDDNFVELGGNSLLAVKVSEEMKRVSGVEFQPDSLFRYRTIRELIDSIGQHKAAEAASVVQLNDIQNGIPIFFLSGVQVYQDVADSLENKQPIYAIYAREELAFADKENNSSLLSTNNLSRAYVDAIKRQAPKGPYILAGLSFGGMLAIEVANELTHEGESVELVVMFDSCLSHAKTRTIMGFCRSGCNVIYRLVRNLLSFFIYTSKSEKNIKYDDPQDFLRMQAYEEASKRFKLGSLDYKGPVLLIKAVDSDIGFGLIADADYGWRKICGNALKIEEVKGGHIDIIHDERSIEVGNIMSSYIDELGS